MEIALTFIIFLLIVYAGYKDFIFSKERERLERKILSKDLTEYVTSEEKIEDSVQEESKYIPVEEATFDQILKAENRR